MEDSDAATQNEFVVSSLLEEVCFHLKRGPSELYNALMLCYQHDYVTREHIWNRLKTERVFALQHIINPSEEKQRDLLRTHNYIQTQIELTKQFENLKFSRHEKHIQAEALSSCLRKCYTEDGDQQITFRQIWEKLQHDIDAARARAIMSNHAPPMALFGEESGADLLLDVLVLGEEPRHHTARALDSISEGATHGGATHGGATNLNGHIGPQGLRPTLKAPVAAQTPDHDNIETHQAVQRPYHNEAFGPESNTQLPLDIPLHNSNAGSAAPKPSSRMRRTLQTHDAASKSQNASTVPSLPQLPPSSNGRRFIRTSWASVATYNVQILDGTAIHTPTKYLEKWHSFAISQKTTGAEVEKAAEKTGDSNDTSKRKTRGSQVAAEPAFKERKVRRNTEGSSAALEEEHGLLHGHEGDPEDGEYA